MPPRPLFPLHITPADNRSKTGLFFHPNINYSAFSYGSIAPKKHQEMQNYFPIVPLPYSLKTG